VINTFSADNLYARDITLITVWAMVPSRHICGSSRDNNIDPKESKVKLSQ
jgi:hypothetical protein